MGAPPVGDTAAGESAAITFAGGADASAVRPRPIFSIRASMPADAFTATGAARVPRAAGRAAGGGGRSGVGDFDSAGGGTSGTAAAGGDGGA